MSKFLAQTKTFLPMVMQKSTTDAIQILEKYPSLCTAQHEGLPKQESDKQETRLQDVQKQEVPPLDPDILRQITCAPTKEDLKIVLHKSPEIPSMVDNNLSEEPKNRATIEPDKSPGSLKVVAVNSENQKTLLKALILDLKVIQRRLVVLLSEGHVWLWQQVLSNRGSHGPDHVIQAKPSQLKESEPVPVLSVGHKAKNMSKETEKGEEKPIMSNLWEAVQESSPAWQCSISNQLGEMQKSIVERLSK